MSLAGSGTSSKTFVLSRHHSAGVRTGWTRGRTGVATAGRLGTCAQPAGGGEGPQGAAIRARARVVIHAPAEPMSLVRGFVRTSSPEIDPALKGRAQPRMVSITCTYLTQSLRDAGGATAPGPCGGHPYSNAGDKRWQIAILSGTWRLRQVVSERAAPIC